MMLSHGDVLEVKELFDKDMVTRNPKYEPYFNSFEHWLNWLEG